MPVAVPSIQTRVNVALKVVRKLTHCILDRRLRKPELLFEECVLISDVLNLLHGRFDLGVALFDLYERYIDQVLQARDCRHCLLNQVELLSLKIVSTAFCLLGYDGIILLTDANHVLLVLIESLAHILTFPRCVRNCSICGGGFVCSLVG